VFAAVKSNLNGVTHDESLADVTGMATDAASSGGVDQVGDLYGEDGPSKRSAFRKPFVLSYADQFARLKVALCCA